MAAVGKIEVEIVGYEQLLELVESVNQRLQELDDRITVIEEHVGLKQR